MTVETTRAKVPDRHLITPLATPRGHARRLTGGGPAVDRPRTGRVRPLSAGIVVAPARLTLPLLAGATATRRMGRMGGGSERNTRIRNDKKGEW